MSFQLVEVETNGSADMYGGSDGHYVRAISNHVNALIDFCYKTYKKSVGKPEVFSWDNYFIIEETNIVIIS